MQDVKQKGPGTLGAVMEADPYYRARLLVLNAQELLRTRRRKSKVWMRLGPTANRMG